MLHESRLPQPDTARLPIEVNGRSYRWPKHPTAVICFDGCDPSYLAAASAAGVIPTFDRLRRSGFWTTVLAAMPPSPTPIMSRSSAACRPPCMASRAISTSTARPAAKS